MQCAQILIH